MNHEIPYPISSLSLTTNALILVPLFQPTKMDNTCNKRTTRKKAIKRRSNEDSLKVVYISSPMKVKTSASKFRSIVQQLTGKNSDIERYLEDDANNNKLGDYYYQFDDCNGDDDYNDDEAGPVLTASASSDHETTLSNNSSSESFLGAIDEVFTSEMEEIFCLNLFCDNINDGIGGDSRVDVLGSYEDLL